MGQSLETEKPGKHGTIEVKDYPEYSVLLLACDEPFF